MKKLINNIAIIASLALGTACAETVTEQQAASYEALKITLSDTEVESRFAASVRGRQDIDIVPQVSGTISKVCVSEGAVVKEGDKLFIIDQVPYKAALQSAEANVKAAEASVDNAKITLDSKRKLYENNVISEYELHLAENQSFACARCSSQPKHRFFRPRRLSQMLQTTSATPRSSHLQMVWSAQFLSA